VREIDRTIEEVRALRGDLSTWLVHLTKGNFFPMQNGGRPRWFSPKDCLINILKTNRLVAVGAIGQFNYKNWYSSVQPADLKAISFTETPISEVFLFVAIKNKPLKFSSYGLVFNRDEMALPPIFAAPVMYFSQPNGNNHFLRTFSKLEQKHYSEYKDILYLFDKFGKTYSGGDYNFMWEREWRIKGDLADVKKHVKFCLCPESEIDFFEKTFAGITFVDPFFNPRQIEKRLKDRGII
jgi:hypothetical protein